MSDIGSTEFYLNETLKGKCYVPTYGFAILPFVVMKFRDRPDVVSRKSKLGGPALLLCIIMVLDIHFKREVVL